MRANPCAPKHVEYIKLANAYYFACIALFLPNNTIAYKRDNRRLWLKFEPIAGVKRNVDTMSKNINPNNSNVRSLRAANPMLQKLEEKEHALLKLDILDYLDYKFKIPKSPLFDIPAYYPAYVTNRRYVNIWGGRGSGKSHEIAGKLVVVRLLCYPDYNWLIIRKIYNTLRSSTFVEIEAYIKEWDLTPFFKITKSPLRIECLLNGNVANFAGMDDSEKLKSIHNIKGILWEEAMEIDNFEDFDRLDKSLRAPIKLPRYYELQHFLLFNPENKNHWIYKIFHDADPQIEAKYMYYRTRAFYLRTTYRDNHFLSPEFGQLLEADKHSNPERYRIDANGEWGVLPSVGLFYKEFAYDKIVVRDLHKSYDRGKPLFLTFDFNVAPYISLSVHQVNTDGNALQIDQLREFCLTENGKVGKIEETLRAFLQEYQYHLGTIYITGDRSGHSKKTNAETDFATILEQLRPSQKQAAHFGVNKTMYDIFECAFNVENLTKSSANPRLYLRQLLFQEIHKGELKYRGQSTVIGSIGMGLPIHQRIDDTCYQTIRDYQEVKESIVEAHTKSDRDKNRTHTSDANDYLYCTLFAVELEVLKQRFKTR